MLPDGADLHEPRGPLFDFFDLMEEVERLWIPLGEALFEIAFVAEVAAVEHVWVDVGPHFGKVRYVAHLAIEVRGGGNRDVGPDLRGARIRQRDRETFGAFEASSGFREGMLG